jgi:hypothetical protein
MLFFFWIIDISFGGILPSIINLMMAMEFLEIQQSQKVNRWIIKRN